MSAVGEPVHAERRSRWLAAAVACVAVMAWAAAPAHAATGFIDGSPLKIYALFARIRSALDPSATLNPNVLPR